MKIGIDISQIAHEGTGVARYVRQLVSALIAHDTKHEYVLFGASLRKQHVFHTFFRSLHADPKRVNLIVVPIPPRLLTILWNTLHIVPVERLLGSVDMFWSSDWTQPPLSHATGITTIHDVSFLRYPESFVDEIIREQKKRLAWAKKECTIFLCDSDATRQDVMDYLHIPKHQLRVVYPGFTL